MIETACDCSLCRAVIIVCRGRQLLTANYPRRAAYKPVPSDVIVVGQFPGSGTLNLELEPTANKPNNEF